MDPELDLLPSAAEYCRWGISAAGIAAFIERNAYAITKDTTTSDVCHMLIKPATTPSGWRDEPSLVDLEKRWYTHAYRCETTSVCQSDPPPGTRSLCDILRSDPSTRHMVGHANVFVSHAWQFRFREVSTALTAFRNSALSNDFDTDDTDLHEQGELFFWFDCFSVDEHASQTHPQSWWSSTFKQAIGLIGHTCMLFTPWHDPEPLSRAWCLWELYCTIVTGSRLSVCLGPGERLAFERSLLEDSDVVLNAFARIDVESAQAGKESDRVMILSAARQMEGGLAKLNRESIQRLREWVVHIAVGMADKAKLGAMGVKVRSTRRRRSVTDGSVLNLKRLEMAPLGAQLLGHDRENFQQLLTVGLALSQLHEGLDYANKLHEEFISAFVKKLKNCNPSDPLVFRSKLLHAYLLWNGRWGTEVEQAANNKIALAEYDELVFSHVWQSTVPVYHPDRLRATTEWVETRIESKLLQVTDENLTKIQDLLQLAIKAYHFRSKSRHEAWAKMLLARAIHVNARNQDVLQMKREKLDEALTVLREEVEPFYVHELGERHVATTAAREEIAHILYEQVNLQPCEHSRHQKLQEANSLLSFVEGHRVEMLGEDHAAVESLRTKKNARPRSASGVEMLHTAQDQVVHQSKALAELFRLPEACALPQLASADLKHSASVCHSDNEAACERAREEIWPDARVQQRKNSDETRVLLEKHFRQEIISRTHRFSSGGNGAQVISSTTMSKRRDVLSKHLLSRSRDFGAGEGVSETMPLVPPPPLPPRMAPFPHSPVHKQSSCGGAGGNDHKLRAVDSTEAIDLKVVHKEGQSAGVAVDAAAIVKSMSSCPGNVTALHASCYSLWKLLFYGNEGHRRTVAAAGGVGAIMDAMVSASHDAKLQLAGCAALASLVIDVDAGRLAVSAGAVNLTINVMKDHSGNAVVQSAALVLLANLSAA